LEIDALGAYGGGYDRLSIGASFDYLDACAAADKNRRRYYPCPFVEKVAALPNIERGNRGKEVF